MRGSQMEQSVNPTAGNSSAIIAPSGARKKLKLISGRHFVATAIGIRIILMLQSCSGSSAHHEKPPRVSMTSLSYSVSMERKYL